MRTTRLRVTLTPVERDELLRLISSGKAAASTLAHAQFLLKSDSPPDQTGLFDVDIAAAVEVRVDTVERVCQHFVGEGLQAALVPRQPTDSRPTKLDGRGEARLIAEGCSPPPGGRDRWALQLLADRLGRAGRGGVDLIRHRAPHAHKQWRQNRITRGALRHGRSVS